MTDLIDRLSGESIPERDKINLHRFLGAERLYAFGEWNRSEIAIEFDLQGDEAIQASQLADKIDSEVGAGNKILYIARVESVCMCMEDSSDRFYHTASGIVNKQKVYEDILIVG